MLIVCLMGRSQSGKSTIEKKMEQIGFKRSISYTTRKPRYCDGQMEKDNDQYRFTSVENFLRLIKDNRLLEYTEYNGNYYGTPRPFGAKLHVCVVDVNGFSKMREVYGNQAVGIYLKTDEKVIEQRVKSKDRLIERKKIDDKMILEIEKKADITIDGNQTVNKVLADILKALKEKGLLQ